MISAQKCRNMLQIKREEFNSKTSEEIYQVQKTECERKIDNLIRYSNSTYAIVNLDSQPNPRLLFELEEAGYAIKIEKYSFSYELTISLPQDVENTSLQDESSDAQEPAQEVGFLSKLKSFVKGILTSNKDTL